MKQFFKGRRSVPTSAKTLPESVDSRHQYARQLLAETREELARADAKASLLFSAFGVISSAVGAVLIADDWSPFQLANGVEWMWWGGVAASVIALLLLGLAVIPRIRHATHRERLYFFGHVAEYKKFDEFAKALGKKPPDSYDRTLDQVWVISRIAKRKYIYTRRSILTFLVAASLFSVSIVADHILGG